MIQRISYLNQLLSFKDKRLIKVVTGIRRCGKSTLLELYREYLLESGIDRNQLIFINFEDYDFLELRDRRNLYQYVKERLIPGEISYVFFDEIQHVENFQDVVDALFIKENIDLYITGSNAKILSGEIATLLSGRYVEISMLPLSLSEYVSAVKGKDIRSIYSDYITYGSFPYITQLLDQPRTVSDYLEGIFNTVVVKDVMSHTGIRDVMVLKDVIRFTLDNIGNPLSTKKIADTLTSAGRKVDSKTIEKYLSALSDAFIVYKASRYDIKGKQYLKSVDKYYSVDLGLRNSLLGRSSFDAGRILENVVYLELLRRDYKVYVGKVDKFEVDFVAINDEGRTYFQVCSSVREPSTLERELRSLYEIKDHYAKYLLTLDDDPIADYDGIIRMNALDWLSK